MNKGQINESLGSKRKRQWKKSNDRPWRLLPSTCVFLCDPTGTAIDVSATRNEYFYPTTRKWIPLISRNETAFNLIREIASRYLPWDLQLVNRAGYRAAQSFDNPKSLSWKYLSFDSTFPVTLRALSSRKSPTITSTLPTDWKGYISSTGYRFRVHCYQL